MSPFVNDVWCALDLNGGISQIRIAQDNVKVMREYTDRAIEHYKHFTNNRQQENVSVYYGGNLVSTDVRMNNCDEQSEISYFISLYAKHPAQQHR